jgi:PAS domain S-box-containing protein
MSDPLLLVGRGGRVTVANAAACRLHRGQASDLVGHLLSAIIDEVPPALARALDVEASRPAMDGEGRPSQATWRRCDQTVIPVSLAWSALWDDQAVAQGLALTVVDSSRRQALAERRHRIEERFRALSGAAPVGIFETDESGRTVYVNERLLAIFGRAEGALLGGGWQQSVHPEDREALARATARAWREDGDFQWDYRVVRPDGEVRWVNSISSLISPTPGGEGFRVGTVTDITDRVRAQETLFQHQRELEELSAQLTFVEERQRREISAELHDGVGQNLVAIKIKVGMLGAEGLPPGGEAMAAEVLGLVDEAIKDIWSLTFELCPPMLYEVGLTAAIEWLLTQYRQRHSIDLSLKGAECQVSLSDEARGALFQSVRELLQNVVKHAEATCAAVSMTVASDILTIEVTDDGAGFVPPLVFPEDANQGTFGLFMVRERMRHLGGRVEFDCDQGRGSRIGLVLPVAEPRTESGARPGDGSTSKPAVDLGSLAHQLNDLLAVVLGLGSLLEHDVPSGAAHAADLTAILFAARRAASLSRKLSAVASNRPTAEGAEAVSQPVSQPMTPAPEEPARGKGTVLIVDDEELIRTTAQRILERLGYRVLVAENGQVGLDVYQVHRDEIGVVLLDVLMPVMDGNQFYEHLKALDPDARVLICTGAADTDEMDELRAKGAQGVIAKPFDTQGLSQAVAEVMAAAAGASRQR